MINLETLPILASDDPERGVVLQHLRSLSEAVDKVVMVNSNDLRLLFHLFVRRSEQLQEARDGFDGLCDGCDSRK